MILEGMNFSHKLIELVKNQDLVVFAGAGVSMNPPTGLPDFEKLMKGLCADYNTEYIIGKPDVSAGKIQRGDSNIHVAVAEELTKREPRPNKIHKYLLDLFPNKESVRIVTTNYDLMFEEEVKRRYWKRGVPVFEAPALPNGDDFRGIIHLHGSIIETKNMIVTDTDFGLAYLSNGYATRFIIQLLQSSNVLFVGYSYDDIMMNYLTKALALNKLKNMFILTCEEKKEWAALGITPIIYKVIDGSHEQLEKGLGALSRYCRYQLLECQERVANLDPEHPPVDEETETFVQEALLTEASAKLVLNRINSLDWMKWLEDNGYFEELFVENGSLSTIGKLIVSWMANKRSEDELIDLIERDGRILNKEAVSLFFWTIVEREDASFNQISYVLLPTISDRYVLEELLNASIRHNNAVTSSVVLKKQMTMRIKRKKQWVNIASSKMDSQYYIDSPYYIESSNCWKEFTNQFSNLEIYKDLLGTLTSQINELYNLADETPTIKIPDLLNLYWLNTECISDSIILVDVFNKMLDILEKIHEKEISLKWIKTALDSDRLFLRTLALAHVRKSNMFLANERMKIVLDLDDILLPFQKESVFHILSENAEYCSSKLQTSLIKTIVQLKNVSGEDDFYEKYNLINWIIAKCPNLPKVDRLQKEKERILKKYPFYKPRKEPEKDITFDNLSWSNDKRKEICRIVARSSISEIESVFEAIAQSEYLFPIEKNLTVRNTATAYPQWAMDSLNSILNEGASPVYLNDLLNGITFVQETSFHKKVLDLLREKSSYATVIGHEYCILLNSYLRNISAEELDTSWAIPVMRFAWNHRKMDSDFIGENYYASSLNSDAGRIADTLLRFVEKHDEVLDLYKELATEKDKYFLCILFSYSPYLYHIDRDWIQREMVVCLKEKNGDEYFFSWSGIAFLRYTMFSEFASDIKPFFDEIVINLNEFESSVARSLCREYAALVVFLSSKPLDDAIRLSSCLDVDKRLSFIGGLLNQIKRMNDDLLKKHFERWMYRFVQRRVNNDPCKLDSKECEAFVSWLPQVGISVFPKLVNLIVGIDVDKIDIISLSSTKIENNECFQFNPKKVIELIKWLEKHNASFLHISKSIKALYDYWCKNKMLTKTEKLYLKNLLLGI